MSQEREASTPTKKENGGLFHRLFGRQGHEHRPRPGHCDLEDIQGIIVRGYRMPIVRHFLLKVDVPAAARKLLGRLVSGDEADAPQITTARDWHVGFEPGPGDDPAEPPRRKPDYCLNLGITWPGLLALEVKDHVPNLSFKSFNAFVAGAAARAERVGDTGENGPQNWIGGFGTGSDHVMLTLHAASPEALTTYSDRLSALLVEDRAFQEIWRGDGMALMEMQDGQAGARFQGPLRLRRRHQHDDDSRRSGALQARPPAAVRALVVRPARRGRELLRARARRNWAAMAVSPSSR